MSYSTERLGDLLVRAGLITEEQLEQALAIQERSGGRLGEVLVHELVMSEDDLARALAGQKGYEHVNLAAVSIDHGAAALLPPRMARRRGIVPIALTDRTVTLAMANPLDVEAIDEVELMTGLTVIPVVASETQVHLAIEKFVEGADALQELSLNKESVVLEAEPAQDDADSGVAVVRMINQIIREAVLSKVSDIHFQPSDNNIRVRYRIDGVLREATVLPKASQSELLSRIKVMAEMDITERRRPQDGRIGVRVADRNLDLRVATLPTPKGEAITLRILDSEVAFRPVEELGMAVTDHSRLMRMLHKPYGAVFVCGPTGSGKSTTLYGLLSVLNDSSREIITIEDPVEYNMSGVTQVAVNPRVGLTFSAGLRTILRSDPDVVMVGEVRDPETAEIAVRSALTGHLVLSSIHTNDAPSALTRLTDMGVPSYITSSGLLGAVAQRLVRRLCPDCKQAHDVPKDQLILAGFTEVEVEFFKPYRAVGCPNCRQTGYSGRVGVFEVMEFTEKLASLYVHQASAEELHRAAVAGGMRSMRRDALDKVAQGLTSLEEIDRVVI